MRTGASAAADGARKAIRAASNNDETSIDRRGDRRGDGRRDGRRDAILAGMKFPLAWNEPFGSDDLNRVEHFRFPCRHGKFVQGGFLLRKKTLGCVVSVSISIENAVARRGAICSILLCPMGRGGSTTCVPAASIYPGDWGRQMVTRG